MKELLKFFLKVDFFPNSYSRSRNDALVEEDRQKSVVGIYVTEESDIVSIQR